MHIQKEDNNQPKINKQPEVPENQTAWNSDNHRIKKKKVKQNNKTGKAVDREAVARQHTVWAGLAEKLRQGSDPWGQAGCGKAVG